MLATKRIEEFNELEAVMLASGGKKKLSGTKAQANKFHDDKNLYTGVHANGGPSTKDDKINDLSQLLDRTEADVRGVKKEKPEPNQEE